MRLVRAARFSGIRASFVTTATIAIVLGGLAVASPIVSPASAGGATGTGGQFVPLQARILDTRQASSVGEYTSQMPVDQWRPVQVTGVQGIPSTGVAAVALNFTALNDTAAGFLKADKDETTANTTSTYLLWNGNGASTNSGVVAVGSDGKIQVEAKGSTTDLLIDVQGYYTTGDPAAGGFVPVTESRLVDTRTGTGLPPTPLASGSTTTVQVSGSAGVPAGASGAMLNFLVLNQTVGGSLNPYPAGTTSPIQQLAFNGTDADSTTSAVGLSAGGALDIKIKMNSSGSTDLVIDVLGYFTAGDSGGAFTPGEARVYDSRSPENQLPAGATRTVQIAGVAGVPSSGIGAVMANVGIFDTGGTAGGWTHVWPDDQTEPNPSMAVQYNAGEQASNILTVAVGADGGITIHNMGTDAIDFAVDIEGWYAIADDPGPGPKYDSVNSNNYPVEAWAPQTGKPLDIEAITDPLNDPAVSISAYVDNAWAASVNASALNASVVAPSALGAHNVVIVATDASGVSTEYDYEFFIGAPPNAPTPGAVDAGNGTALVNWTGGATNGAPLNGYHLTLMNETSGIETFLGRCVACDSVAISNLTNGDRYHLEIFAISDAGLSQEASSPTFVPTAGTTIQSCPTGDSLCQSLTYSAPAATSISTLEFVSPATDVMTSRVTITLDAPVPTAQADLLISSENPASTSDVVSADGTDSTVLPASANAQASDPLASGTDQSSNVSGYDPANPSGDAQPTGQKLFCNKYYDFSDHDGTYSIQRACSASYAPWGFRLAHWLVVAATSDVQEPGMEWALNGVRQPNQAAHTGAKAKHAYQYWHGRYSKIPTKGAHIAYSDVLSFSINIGGETGRANVQFYGSFVLTNDDYGNCTPPHVC